MVRARYITAAAAALLLTACAHDTNRYAKRGAPAGVNSYSTVSTADRIIETGPSSSKTVPDKTTSPVTGSVNGSVQPSPSAMGTTTSSGSLAGTTSITSTPQQGGTTQQPPSASTSDTTTR